MYYLKILLSGWVDTHHLLERQTTRPLWTLTAVTTTLMMKSGRTFHPRPETSSRIYLSLTRGDKQLLLFINQKLVWKNQSLLLTSVCLYSILLILFSFSKRMTIFEALDHPWLNVSTTLCSLQKFQLLVHTNHKIYRPVPRFYILHDWNEIFVLLMYTDIFYALVSLAKSFTCIYIT